MSWRRFSVRSRGTPSCIVSPAEWPWNVHAERNCFVWDGPMKSAEIPLVCEAVNTVGYTLLWWQKWAEVYRSDTGKCNTRCGRFGKLDRRCRVIDINTVIIRPLLHHAPSTMEMMNAASYMNNYYYQYWMNWMKQMATSVSLFHLFRSQAFGHLGLDTISLNGQVFKPYMYSCS